MQSGEDWRGDDYLSQYVEQVAVAARPSSAPHARALSAKTRVDGPGGSYRQLPQLVAKFTKSAAIAHSLLT